MCYTTALRHIYTGIIEDTIELAPAPLLKPLLEPLLAPLTICFLFKLEPLPTPIWEYFNKPFFDPIEAIILPNIKYILLLVFTVLNFLLLSRVLEGLYKLYTILPI